MQISSILDLLILQKEVSSADYSFAKTFSMFLVQIEKKQKEKISESF